MLRVNRTAIIDLPIFLILSPLMFVFYQLVKVLLNKKISLLYLSFSVVLSFSYFPILYDTSVNFFRYYNYINGAEYINLYLYIPYFFNEKFSFQFMHFIFFMTSLCLYINLLIYARALEDKRRQISILIFLFALGSIDLRLLMDLNRFYLAVSFFILYFYFDNFKPNKNKFFLFFLIFLSVCFHLSVILLVVLYIFVSYFRFTKYSVTWLILGIFTFSLFDQQVLCQFKSYGGLFSEGCNYLSYNATGRAVDRTFYQEFYYIIKLPIIITFFYLSFKISNHKIKSFFILLCSINLIYLPYVTLSERYFLSLLLFLPFLLIYINRVSVGFVFLLFVFYIYVLANLYSNSFYFRDNYKVVLPDSEIKLDLAVKPFYMPTIFLLNIEAEGYSDTHIINQSERRW